jgi:hypothetical protein
MLGVRKEQPVKAHHWASTEADVGLGILILSNSSALAHAY